MAITRPFSYNTGSTITGTIQVGNLAVGTPTSGFPATGLFWWDGPDEDLGYVIAAPNSGNTQPTSLIGVTASVQFYRTKTFLENEFINLSQFVSNKFGTPQTFSTGDDASTWLTNNGYWNSWISTAPTPTPSTTLTPTITPTNTNTPTPTSTVTTSVTPTYTPTNTTTPTQTPTNTVTPSVTPTLQTSVTFSQTFTGGQAPGTTIENAWTTFRGQLTGTYTKFDFTSSNGQGYTGITDAIKVQQLATNIKNGTATSVIISGVTWLVGCCACRQGGSNPNAVEFSNVGSCSASSTAALRPWIANANWGGIGSTVGAATQTLTLKFY